MLKYIAAAGVAFATSSIVSKALDEAGTFRPQSTVTDLNTFLDSAVEVLNRDRGTRTGGAVFTNASRVGNTVVIELTMHNAPKHYNADAASANLLGQVKHRWCVRKFEPFLRQGGAVIYRYQTSTGLVMFDSKVDAQVCRLSV